jgi:hypothetical protein
VDEQPLLVTIFTRPESLCGLHQLVTFVTNDPEVVASPWSTLPVRAWLYGQGIIWKKGRIKQYWVDGIRRQENF